MRRSGSCCLALVGACLLLATARPAVAQSQSGIAEALYEEGKTLVAQGKYAEACPKFAESYKQEPGVGTLLNLAACNEHLGKTATAWTQFTESYQILSQQVAEARAAYAGERRDALAKKLSRVAIDVPASNRVAGLTVTLDGASVGAAAWGVAVPVDPGKHVVRATAPGCVPWEGSFDAGDVSDRKTVTVPLLQAAAAPVKAAPTQPAPTSAAGDATTDKGGSRPVTVPVVILGVTTLALAAGAGVTGGLYVSRKSKYDAINNKTGSTADERSRLHNEAATMANINLALTAGAVASGVATLIFYFTTPKQSNTALVPWFDQRTAGASLLHSF